MLDSLFQWISERFESLYFFAVLEEFEGGVIMRWGKYHKDMKPGVNWMWPVMESYYSDNIVRKTDNLISQSLYTADDVGVLLSVFISYKIRNVRRWLLEVEDSNSVLTDMTYGVIAEIVAESTWDEVKHPAFKSRVFYELKQRASKQLGVTLESVQFCDLTRSKTLRILQD